MSRSFGQLRMVSAGVSIVSSKKALGQRSQTKHDTSFLDMSCSLYLESPRPFKQVGMTPYCYQMTSHFCGVTDNSLTQMPTSVMVSTMVSQSVFSGFRLTIHGMSCFVYPPLFPHKHGDAE